ncbi:MAG: hypothetical protein IJ147_03660 [Lachnospiraceae bacterium]|nr:hypothetical protein [Lachnospiraceae bacterium]
MDIEKIMQIYDRFVEILKEFSMPPQEQIKVLHGTVVADELATDFSEIALPYAKILVENQWINKDHFLIVKEINQKLDEMSECSELWDKEAVMYSKEWEECRKKGELLLRAMNAI